MKYIIMCGGTYGKWQKLRQLVEVKGEPIVARTIRLLRENGITDIAISSNHAAFEQFGVPVLHHENGYHSDGYNQNKGYWCDCFYPTDEPVCYLFGDVVYSPHAIRTIIDTHTDDIAFFGSKPPFAPEYPKWYIEPFGFKVQNQKHLHEAIQKVKDYDAAGVFNRQPIAWEVWNVIHGGNPNEIDYSSYIGINDYTCDIDYPNEAELVSARVSG